MTAGCAERRTPRAASSRRRVVTDGRDSSARSRGRLASLESRCRSAHVLGPKRRARATFPRYRCSSVLRSASRPPTDPRLTGGVLTAWDSPLRRPGRTLRLGRLPEVLKRLHRHCDCQALISAGHDAVRRRRGRRDEVSLRGRDAPERARSSIGRGSTPRRRRDPGDVRGSSARTPAGRLGCNRSARSSSIRPVRPSVHPADPEAGLVGRLGAARLCADSTSTGGGRESRRTSTPRRSESTLGRQGADPLLYVTVGTGIGAGDRRRPSAARTLHPEMGHLPMPGAPGRWQRRPTPGYGCPFPSALLGGDGGRAGAARRLGRPPEQADRTTDLAIAAQSCPRSGRLRAVLSPRIVVGVGSSSRAPTSCCHGPPRARQRAWRLHPAPSSRTVWTATSCPRSADPVGDRGRLALAGQAAA